MPTGLAQCDSVQLYWDPAFVNGYVFINLFVIPCRLTVPSITMCMAGRSVYFYGTILGGTSFPIQGSLHGINDTDIGFNGVGFNWTINIASGTQVLLIGSDDRGIGSGGKALFTIEDSPSNTCVNSNSPSSTAGVPPGSYPTSASGSTSHGRTHSSS